MQRTFCTCTTRLNYLALRCTDVLGEEWKLAAIPELSESAIRTIEASADAVFSKVTDDIRGAAQAAAGRALTPERIQELCRAGLQAVFGTATLHKP